jgi:hypothetical protein
MSQSPEDRFLGMDPQTRRDVLEGLAMRFGEERYTISLTEKDIAEGRLEFAENVFHEEDIQAEKKQAVAVYTDRIKELKGRRKTLRGELKTGLREKRGLVYYIDDQETGWLYTYDEDGVLLGQRRLRPDERQTRIVPMHRIDPTGTDG